MTPCSKKNKNRKKNKRRKSKEEMEEAKEKRKKKKNGGVSRAFERGQRIVSISADTLKRSRTKREMRNLRRRRVSLMKRTVASDDDESLIARSLDADLASPVSCSGDVRAS
ncbi:hypothetical protein ANTRET_LOCUS1987 [Anthophora retusa]